MSHQAKWTVATYAERLAQDLSAPRPFPKHLPETFREIWNLGEAGKLWSMEIIYQGHGDPEPKRKLMRNLTEPRLAAYRVKLFHEGLAFSVDGDASHLKIICPMDVPSVDLYQQFGHFDR